MAQLINREVTPRSASRRRLRAHSLLELTPEALAERLRDPDELRTAVALILTKLKHMA